MRRFDGASATAWCHRRGFQFPDRPRETSSAQFDGTKVFSLSLPDAGLRIVDLANWSLTLDDAVETLPYESVLVWLLDWDIWSHERERAGVQLLHALVGADNIEALPAIEFSSDELSSAQALIALVALFQWDAVVLPAHGEYLLWFSHHGVVEIHTRAADVEAAVVDGIKHFGADTTSP